MAEIPTVLWLRSVLYYKYVTLRVSHHASSIPTELVLPSRLSSWPEAEPTARTSTRRSEGHMSRSEENTEHITAELLHYSLMTLVKLTGWIIALRKACTCQRDERANPPECT